MALTSQRTDAEHKAREWACPRCHRVVTRLTEHAELFANGERRHIVCDQCVEQLRADPMVVLDFVDEVGA